MFLLYICTQQQEHQNNTIMQTLKTAKRAPSDRAETRLAGLHMSHVVSQVHKFLRIAFHGA
jgi:hypothetical protein